jgi:hypothetical protein
MPLINLRVNYLSADEISLKLQLSAIALWQLSALVIQLIMVRKSHVTSQHILLPLIGQSLAEAPLESTTTHIEAPYLSMA